MTPRSCALVAVCALILSGCAQAPLDRGEPTPGRMDPSRFAAAGPWAEEFADAAVSPYQIGILADGVITADERADARARTKECMRERGYRYEEHRDGAADIDPLHGQREGIEQVMSYLRGCSRKFDHDISMLFDAIRRNPEHRWHVCDAQESSAGTTQSSAGGPSARTTTTPSWSGHRRRRSVGSTRSVCCRRGERAAQRKGLPPRASVLYVEYFRLHDTLRGLSDREEESS
jgi:hypothetical protein